MRVLQKSVSDLLSLSIKQHSTQDTNHPPPTHRSNNQQMTNIYSSRCENDDTEENGGVQFSTITVREYYPELSHSTLSCNGPPIGLSFSHCTTYTRDIAEHEKLIVRRNVQQMHLPWYVREDILLEHTNWSKQEMLDLVLENQRIVEDSRRNDIQRFNCQWMFSMWTVLCNVWHMALCNFYDFQQAYICPAVLLLVSAWYGEKTNKTSLPHYTQCISTCVSSAQ